VHTRLPRIVLCLTVALAACATNNGDGRTDDASTPREDCDTAGDEDGNGLADCDDPVCASARSCQPTCGNDRREPGEECDDGNTVDGDGCDSNCTLPRCCNAIQDPGEECDDGNTIEGDGCDSNCTLPRCGNGIVDTSERCDDGNLANGDGCDSRCASSAVVYVKASNTRADHELGMAVAISADGSTLAVGAPLEDSAATGIDGDQSDASAQLAGAVYVFTWNGSAWSQQAYIKASNTGASDLFGTSVALSTDGSTLAVGAIGESSAAAGIDGDQRDDSAGAAGAVYVFHRTGSVWQQQAYIKSSNPDAIDQFGLSVSLSGDASMLAVGAIGEASAATGIDGDQADNTAAFAGAVYVFTRAGATWHQQAYIKASNADKQDGFGGAVSLSGDGSTLAVAAAVEKSAARGINGDQANNSAASAGAVYVFTRDETSWHQEAYVKASNTGAADSFGTSLALSLDGSTMAIGALGEDSSARGINGNQASNGTLESGAVYVFGRIGSTWSQRAYVKASNTGIADQFGWSVALSADGSMMAVGAVSEDSAATSIGGDQTDDSATFAGAAYMFRRDGTTWHQQAYIKPINTSFGYQFGWSLSLANDGTLAVGAPTESGAATGIGGDPFDQSASSAGSVFIYK